MTMRNIRFMALGVSAVMLLAGCSAGGGGGDSDEIVVGAVYSITGSQASIDEPAYNGFKLAAKEINEAGGINGKQIRVAFSDAASDTTTLTNVVSELIENDGAVALGGTNDSTFALAAGPIAQAAGIPFVASGATLPTLPDQVGDYMFMACYGDDLQAQAIANYSMEELDAKTAWALVDQAYDFTTALNTFFQERFIAVGGEIVLEDSYKSGDTDYSAQIARLQALPTQPDVLFVSAIPNEAGIITQQIREAGLTQPIVSGDGYDTPLVAEVAGDNSKDVYFSTHVSLESEDAVVQNFVKAYTEEYGTGPENAFAALGYDTMNLIADALKRAADDSDPAAVKDALASTQDLVAVTGTISYPEGSRKPSKAVSIMRIVDEVTTFVKVIEP
ncbi:amino acid ABC transporter substrate-binding protein [Cryobacterium ruanii]|uniref:Amino acid ABC transporter substrate-binding protein n=2 Tax=Cryobacterium ruanii TaxID=1259197 RepID=A0A4R9APQ0_9MICO|nr:amino acid ABC transporter substrate-binding protein [Cryobacterium ruanii]